MAKPSGFLEYERALPPGRPIPERIRDWEEFHRPCDGALCREQAARCMDCGIPFCHAGLTLGRFDSGCPLHNLIPEWNELIYLGLWEQAYRRLAMTNNFPEFTGRVCLAPCEGACTNGYDGEPVTIRHNELAIAEMAFAEGWVYPEKPIRRTGKRVAVVGSGPAGLAAADQLNRAGHTVTVYERADRPGGLLMYGIPNMKLSKAVVARRIRLMEELGVVFKIGVDIGKDIGAETIMREYDAAVLCCGAAKPRDIRVESGRELEGIHFAVDFLSRNTRSLLNSGLTDGQYISAKDKHVIVIGGGDTGTDCVATSIRHGCKSVVQFEILPEKPIERAASNPWPEWPDVRKTDYGQEEAQYLFGEAPRRYCVMTKRFTGDESGRVRAAHTLRVRWEPDEYGRFVPREIPGTQQVWQADLVLLAMGFLGPEDEIAEQWGIARDARSNLWAEEGKYWTSRERVFAAGDARRGQSLVVWAIAEGRGAARECDRYLMGETGLK